MGLLTQKDLEKIASAGSLSKASNADLVEELARRLKATTGKENR